MTDKKEMDDIVTGLERTEMHAQIRNLVADDPARVAYVLGLLLGFHNLNPDISLGDALAKVIAFAASCGVKRAAPTLKKP